MADNDTIAAALAKSRAAHLAYRQALAANNPAGVRTALERALETRTIAQDLDPDHTALAWSLDPYTKLHDNLLTYYRDQLARLAAA